MNVSKVARKAGRFALLVCALAALVPSGASAQIPFFKKKKKAPPPAEAAAPNGPPETPAPGAPPPAAPGAPPAAPGAPAVNVPPPAPPPASAQAPGAPQRTPDEQTALNAAVAAALEADKAPDTTVGHIRDRLARWRQVQILDPQNAVAPGAITQATAELTAANDRVMQAGKADQTTQDLMRSKLDAARRAISAKTWGEAETHLAFIRDKAPNHPDLPVLERELVAARRFDDLKRQAMYVIPILVILGAGIVVVVKFGGKYREDRQKRIEEMAAKRQAVLQIVDGVGRGKLVTIDKEKPVFKIGSALGAQDAEKNDLVVSDSATIVSRYHCTLVRKDGDYYLVDSSMNGTSVNGELLKRGAHQLLEDGDEITIADVSRLKFLHT